MSCIDDLRSEVFFSVVHISSTPLDFPSSDKRILLLTASNRSATSAISSFIELAPLSSEPSHTFPSRFPCHHIQSYEILTRRSVPVHFGPNVLCLGFYEHNPNYPVKKLFIRFGDREEPDMDHFVDFILAFQAMKTRAEKARAIEENEREREVEENRTRRKKQKKKKVSPFRFLTRLLHRSGGGGETSTSDDSLSSTTPTPAPNESNLPSANHFEDPRLYSSLQPPARSFGLLGSSPSSFEVSSISSTSASSSSLPASMPMTLRLASSVASASVASIPSLLSHCLTSSDGSTVTATAESLYRHRATFLSGASCQLLNLVSDSSRSVSCLASRFVQMISARPVRDWRVHEWITWMKMRFVNSDSIQIVRINRNTEVRIIRQIKSFYQIFAENDVLDSFFNFWFDVSTINNKLKLYRLISKRTGRSKKVIVLDSILLKIGSFVSKRFRSALKRMVRNGGKETFRDSFWSSVRKKIEGETKLFRVNDNDNSSSSFCYQLEFPDLRRIEWSLRREFEYCFDSIISGLEISHYFLIGTSLINQMVFHYESIFFDRFFNDDSSFIFLNQLNDFENEFHFRIEFVSFRIWCLFKRDSIPLVSRLVAIQQDLKDRNLCSLREMTFESVSSILNITDVDLDLRDDCELLFLGEKKRIEQLTRIVALAFRSRMVIIDNEEEGEGGEEQSRPHYRPYHPLNFSLLFSYPNTTEEEEEKGEGNKKIVFDRHLFTSLQLGCSHLGFSAVDCPRDTFTTLQVGIGLGRLRIMFSLDGLVSFRSIGSDPSLKDVLAFPMRFTSPLLSENPTSGDDYDDETTKQQWVISATHLQPFLAYFQRMGRFFVEYGRMHGNVVSFGQIFERRSCLDFVRDCRVHVLLEEREDSLLNIIPSENTTMLDLLNGDEDDNDENRRQIGRRILTRRQLRQRLFPKELLVKIQRGEEEEEEDDDDDEESITVWVTHEQLTQAVEHGELIDDEEEGEGGWLSLSDHPEALAFTSARDLVFHLAPLTSTEASPMERDCALHYYALEEQIVCPSDNFCLIDGDSSDDDEYDYYGF